MDKNVIAKNNTCEVVEEYLSENSIEIATYDTMQEDVDTFIADKALLEEQIVIAMVDPAGIAENQMDAKRADSKYIFESICSPSMRYARTVGDHDMERFFKHTEAMLFKYSLTALGPLVKGILDKATLLVATVPAYVTSTKITTLIITGGTNLNETYKGWLGKPKLAIKAKNAALLEIDVIQKRIFEIDFVNLMDDATFFNVSNPALREGLAASMTIDDLPTEHDGIEGFGHDEFGEVLIGMTVTNLDMPLRPAMVTNNIGFYHDDTFVWGTYRYRFDMVGKVSQTITVVIKRGETTVVNVVLLPVPPPPPAV